MKKLNDSLKISASDLSNYLSCRHLTELDLLVQHKLLKEPPFNNPHADAVQKRGYEHESSYVDHLITHGLSVKRLDTEVKEEFQSGYDRTITAMKEGYDVIVQATLKMDQYFGRADVLRKVSRPSSLGNYSYEVLDTKLSKETKATSVLQLCLYSEMLAKMQELEPEYLYIVTPGKNFVPEQYRLDEFNAYYRLIKNNLLNAIDTFDPTICSTPEKAQHYPDPRAHCDVCKWINVCEVRRRNDDHLSYVAGLSTSQRKELIELGIKSLKDLAETDQKMPSESLVNAKEQARLQLEARNTKKPKFETLPFIPEKGLARLPEPNQGDLFFDLEGDVFYGTAGIEYLWGYCYLDEKGVLQYQCIWSCDYVAEKAAFETFIDFVVARKKVYPNLKVYHYAPYEPGALKRLMGRYGSKEAELDQLLREESFVDLYSITRQSIRAGIEKYSIKDLEQFYSFKRNAELRLVGPHKRFVEHSLELGAADIPTESLDMLQEYNKDDCASAFHLREWLETLRAKLIHQGTDIQRPPIATGEVSEDLSESLKKMNELREELQKSLNPIPEDRTESEKGQWLLSELIQFYRREDKFAFFEKFRLQEMDSLELLEDKSGISGLTLIDKKVGGTDKCPIERYQFIPQEMDVRPPSDVFIEGGLPGKHVVKIGTVEKIDFDNQTIDIKKNQANKDVVAHAIWAWSMFDTSDKAQRIMELAQYVLDNGIDNESTAYKAAREIITRKNPDLKNRITETTSLKRAREMAVNLNNSYLAIQGPPGTGKSYTASRVILSLVEKGYKVGVTALSHKVISNLIHKVHEASEKEKVPVNLYQKTDDHDHKAVTYLKNGKQVEDALSSKGSAVIGCTDFTWAKMPREGLDYLVIDEAGQFSLAGLLAIAHCTKNIILLGDGAQLQQPLKGSHPDGCEVSALDYIVGGAKTLPDEKGVFLGVTYRLNDRICAFNSELFYESRLQSVKGNEAQVISGHTKFAGKALALKEVDHKGNSNKCFEEIKRIKEIVKELLEKGNTYTVIHDGKFETHQITEDSIKIISPYNAQVNLLARELPSIKVGTVDKFQGQEAPIVIFSVCTSSAEEAPRGMDFLYSGNRLNVAVSRAQCLFIMVASPNVFEVDCKSPKQMKLANAYARFREKCSV